MQTVAGEDRTSAFRFDCRVYFGVPTWRPAITTASTEGLGPQSGPRQRVIRSRAQRAGAREHGDEDGEHQPFPDVITVTHCSLVGVADPHAPLAGVTLRNWRRLGQGNN
jgi:hypothetical protein